MFVAVVIGFSWVAYQGAPSIGRFLTRIRDRRIPGLLVIPTDTRLLPMMFRCESRSGSL